MASGSFLAGVGWLVVPIGRTDVLHLVACLSICLFVFVETLQDPMPKFKDLYTIEDLKWPLAEVILAIEASRPGLSVATSAKARLIGLWWLRAGGAG